MQVILDLLQDLQPAPRLLPMGRDSRLQRIMNDLYDDPADERGLDAWARLSGASVRTLARFFSRETA